MLDVRTEAHTRTGPSRVTRMRQAYGLLRLCERYGDARVDALCARAIGLASAT